MIRKYPLWLSCAALLGQLALNTNSLAQQPETADTQHNRPAVDSSVTGSVQPGYTFPAALASEALVLDIIQAGNRYIAVGERGHILLSEDGRQWRQSLQVPTQATLTAVYFRAGMLWAVGHDSVVLFSADLGETWTLQYQDAEAEQPLMAVLFNDPHNGLAIGAYGLVLQTQDAGKNWRASSMLDLVTVVESAADTDDGGAAVDDDDEFFEDDIEYHLNAVAALDNNRLLIAAEAGNGYRSRDGGASWEHFEFPYAGSMFGLIAEDKRCLLAFGLRGRIQRSCDFGTTWQAVSSSSQDSLFGAANSADGTYLVGANGAIVAVQRHATRARTVDFDSGEDLAACYAVEHHLVIGGEDGLGVVAPDEMQSATEAGGSL